MKKTLTLCIIQQNKKILLGMKKRGFGAGKWNGFGGKLHDGESIESALKRETSEEAGILIKNPEKMGIVEFEFSGDPVILEVHIFQCTDFEGEPVETEEMSPQWFDVGKLPYGSMWPDDKFWVPLFLRGQKFRGKFVFGKNTVILSHDLKTVSSL